MWLLSIFNIVRATHDSGLYKIEVGLRIIKSLSCVLRSINLRVKHTTCTRHNVHHMRSHSKVEATPKVVNLWRRQI